PTAYRDPSGLFGIPGTPIQIASPGGPIATTFGAAGTVVGASIGYELGTAGGIAAGFVVGGVLGLGAGPLGSLGGAIVLGYIGGVVGGVVVGTIGGAVGGAIGGLFDDPCAGQLNCNETVPPSADPRGGGGKSGP